MTKIRKNNEKGFGIMETLIGIALLGVIAVPFLIGLSTAFRANLTAKTQSVGLSLAQNQLEDLKKRPYVRDGNSDITHPPVDADSVVNGEVTYDKIADVDVPVGYTICSVSRDGSTVVPGIIYGVVWDSTAGTPVADDAGLQRIKLVIKFGDKELVTLETYKVER